MFCLKQHFGKFATFSRRYADTPHPSALTGCHLPLKGKALVQRWFDALNENLPFCFLFVIGQRSAMDKENKPKI